MAVPSRSRSSRSDVHPATQSPADLLRDVLERRARGSGPGGQHRNKTETAVELVHRPTGIVAEASERRSLAENRSVAIKRLRLKLALLHRSPGLRQPSLLWVSRTEGKALAVSPQHEDYPSLVAEALDELQSHGFRMAPAAEALGVTASQLARLFRKDMAAWTLLNRQRAAVGLRPLV